MDPQQCGCRGSTPFVLQTSEREVIEGHRQCGLIDDGLQLDCGGRPRRPTGISGIATTRTDRPLSGPELSTCTDTWVRLTAGRPPLRDSGAAATKDGPQKFRNIWQKF